MPVPFIQESLVDHPPVLAVKLSFTRFVVLLDLSIVEYLVVLIEEGAFPITNVIAPVSEVKLCSILILSELCALSVSLTPFELADELFILPSLGSGEIVKCPKAVC